MHFPWSRLHRTLSGILPCEARTFLTHLRGCDRLFYLPFLILTQIEEFINSFYTLKQLPPTNSLQIEFLGSSSLLMPRK